MLWRFANVHEYINCNYISRNSNYAHVINLTALIHKCITGKNYSIKWLKLRIIQIKLIDPFQIELCIVLVYITWYAILYTIYSLTIYIIYHTIYYILCNDLLRLNR